MTLLYNSTSTIDNNLLICPNLMYDWSRLYYFSTNIRILEIITVMGWNITALLLEDIWMNDQRHSHPFSTPCLLFATSSIPKPSAYLKVMVVDTRKLPHIPHTTFEVFRHISRSCHMQRFSNVSRSPFFLFREIVIKGTSWLKCLITVIFTQEIYHNIPVLTYVFIKYNTFWQIICNHIIK